MEEEQGLFPSLSGPSRRLEGNFKSSGSSRDNIAAGGCPAFLRGETVATDSDKSWLYLMEKKPPFYSVILYLCLGFRGFYCAAPCWARAPNLPTSPSNGKITDVTNPRWKVFSLSIAGHTRLLFTPREERVNPRWPTPNSQASLERSSENLHTIKGHRGFGAVTLTARRGQEGLDFMFKRRKERK